MTCFNGKSTMNKTLYFTFLIMSAFFLNPQKAFCQPHEIAIADSIETDSAFSVTAQHKLRLPDADMMYKLPYSKRQTVNPNYKRLWLHTGTLFAGGIAALGILELLPEDATAWNKQEIRETPFFKRWWNNVSNGPVWDHDNWVFNYVLHPYAGAAYYMGARSLGFSQWQSFTYCFCISTFFWEYGIEAFMEKPSIQDLVITPVCGMFIGELFYKIKRGIVANDYRIGNSRFLGNFVSFLIDPVNEFIGMFAGNPCRTQSKNHANISSSPFLLNSQGYASFGYSVCIQL